MRQTKPGVRWTLFQPMAHVLQLGVRRPADPARVAGGLHAPAELMEVDHHGHTLRAAAGRRLCRPGHAEPHRRGHEDRDGEAYDEPRHARQDRQRERASRAGAAWAPARRHWSRVVLSMPSRFAVVMVARS